MNIVIDGIIFQWQAGRPLGISRLWRNLIPNLSNFLQGHSIYILRRKGFPSGIVGVTEYEIPSYRPGIAEVLDRDDALLAQVCSELNADVFLSTYYTRAPGFTNIQMIYDMIPEIFGWDLSHPEWLAKQRAVANASSFIAISESTKRDLSRLYSIRPEMISVAYCGVSEEFYPANRLEINRFLKEYNLLLPYFLLVGNRGLYKNCSSFFQAFAGLSDRVQLQVLAVGGEARLQPHELEFAQACNIQFIPWLRDEELRAAYSGALAFVYPSRYEGFGLPVAEAMACGCPVITANNSSLPEVGGDAPLYVNPDSYQEIAVALNQVRMPDIRVEMTRRGLIQAQVFNWKRMAESVARDILNADASMKVPQIYFVGARKNAAARAMPTRSDHLRFSKRCSGTDPLVSVIVSAYNSEEFMQECLQDLEAQTIADRLEIIVVDAHSPQDEGAIVEEYQRKYTNIRYIRTEERIGVYAAWNLAISASSGKYIFTFSTNDRLSPNACEVLARALDEHPQVALVYGDSYLTTKPHESFEHHTRSGEYRWPEFSFEDLLQHCLVGPHPMWRREIHDELGYFDESYVAIGDQEFWLRIGERYPLLHIPVFTGLYWESPEALSRKGDLPNREIEKIHAKYQQRYFNRLKGLVESAAHHQGQDPESLFLREFGFLPKTAAGLQALADLCRALGKTTRAELYQEKAETITVELCLQRADWLLQQGNRDEAKELLARYNEILPGNDGLLVALEQIECELPGSFDRSSAQVDIVVPVYRQPRLVQRCVNTILRTTQDAHIILVDDASADIATRFLLNSYIQHPRITVVYNPQNLGFIGASKLGAQQGRAPFILFLNSDIEALEPGWLERMIPSDEDVAIVGAKLLYPPDLPGPLAGTIQHAGVARMDDGRPFHPFLGLPADHPPANVAREVNAVTGACFLIRRRVWEELGGWDERFGRGVYEDVDLCWQARQRGYRILYQPAATLLHRESASKEIDGSHNLHQHSRENVEKLQEKWPSLRSDEEIFFGGKDFQRFQNARAWLRKAQKALERKNMQEVIAAVRRAVKIAPELPEVMVGYAQILSVKGDHEGAAQAFEKAIRANLKNWPIWLRTIDEWQAAGSPERAAALLARLKEQFPNDPQVLEREALLAAWMPRPEPSASDNLPPLLSQVGEGDRGDDGIPGPEQVFSMLLQADDLPAALQEHRDKLDARLLELVRANAAAAHSDGDLELASGLDDLAEVIRDMLAVPQTESQEDRDVRTLEMLLDADDLPAALETHPDRLTPGLLALVRMNAQAARSDGDTDLAGGLDDLVDYIEQALSARQMPLPGDAVPAAAD